LSRTADFDSNLQSSFMQLHAPYRALLQAALAETGPALHRVLDLGCGDGNKRDWLLQHVAEDGHLLGIDRDRTALAAAAWQGHPQCAWVLGDACALPCADASFERCWCIAALHLFGDTAQALREMRRVLQAGGAAVIILVEQRWVRLRQWPTAILAAAPSYPLEAADDLGHDLRQQLAAAGFADPRLRAYALGIADDDPQLANLALTSWPTLAPYLPNDPALHAAGAAAEEDTEIEEIAVLFALRAWR
jgi:SAM-dependent methyltransferase